jgi:RNA 2',3'-cyclic 3'-phosphodiesterase
MRTFVAIELPEEIRGVLAGEQARFRSAAADARWTRPEGIHLTLKFLGEVPDNQVARVERALREIGHLEPFRVRIKGFGFFPEAVRPHVFWAGVDAPPQLAQLAARVEATLAPLGFAPEKRAFSPHLTLVRFKVPRRQPKLQELVAAGGDGVLGDFEVSEFFLWESKLTPHGAQYRKVAHFP